VVIAVTVNTSAVVMMIGPVRLKCLRNVMLKPENAGPNKMLIKKNVTKFNLFVQRFGVKFN